MEKRFDYVLARAKAIVTGDEVMGYVHICGNDGRQTLIYITIPETNEVVYVDPVSVELFTGLRCAATGKRIFEGDVIRLHTMNGVTLNYYANNHDEDFLCEICMPLNFTKQGAQKRLYVYEVAGVSRHFFEDTFHHLASQWDAMEWEIVGRADDHLFGGNNVSVIGISADREETTTRNFFGNGCNIWPVWYGKDWKDRELFGTFKRRQHIIRRYEENCIGRFKDYKPRYKGVRAAEFNCIVSKWNRDCKKYLGYKAGELWGTN